MRRSGGTSTKAKVKTRSKRATRVPGGATAESVAKVLREDILAGKLAAADPLRQDAIAQRFKTSRVPVREALRQLEAEGLVTFEPNRGAFVTSLEPADVLEMLEIRAALEPYVLRLAIPNLSQTDLETAEQILSRDRRNISPVEWDRINWQFHSTLYLPAHRPRLFALIESNYFHAAIFLREKIAIATGIERPQEQHAQILDACRRGNADKAAHLMKHHIEETRKRLATELHRARL